MLLTVLVVIVVIAYVVESLLDNLNQSAARNPLDPKIAGLYDSKERERSIAYSAEKTRFSFYTSTFSTIVMILALAYGWFATIDSWARENVDRFGFGWSFPEGDEEILDLTLLNTLHYVIDTIPVPQEA